MEAMLKVLAEHYRVPVGVVLAWLVDARREDEARESREDHDL